MDEEKAEAIVKCIDIVTEVKAKGWVHYHNGDIHLKRENDEIAEETLALLKVILMKDDNAES